MNTFFELSKALGDDENYAVNILNQINNKQTNGTCFLKSETDIFVSGIAAGLNNRGLHSVVDIEGKSK
jgi:adenosine/AMP kinase